MSKAVLLLMAVAAILACALLAANADPLPPLRLKSFSPAQARIKCEFMHGSFYLQGDGVYGCQFARGTVVCNAQQICVGYPKERVRVAPAVPIEPQEHGYWFQDRW